ncbi:MAG TPA: SdrD B-like domain-containing protein, partial [Candidatus Eisenbacteria bacterium]|nr:SdrD B-like domain-containing protein [Candidatus Eisenbacteria bacterium]
MSARRIMRLALALLALALPAAPAAAQTVRGFTPRFTTNDRGDITLIGNTLMSCSGGGQCNQARTGNGNQLNNNDHNMQYVDVDAVGSTFCSSAALLSLPSGATVLWAGLYWGGFSNNAARNQVILSTPASASLAITATQLDASGSAYQGFRDVTAQVTAGGNGTYMVANVQSSTGTNMYAGWSLVVAYRLASQPIRNIVVFDGYSEVAPGATVTIPVSGFVTPPGGIVNTRLGVVAYEGDLDFTGDQFSLNGVALGNATNPTTNFFNSSISQLGVSFANKAPNYLNQLGFDTDLLALVNAIPNGATSATITLSSVDDRYYPGAVTFSTDLYAPVISGNSFRKTVVDLNGAPARPGDVLEYTIAMTNSGDDAAAQTVLADTLPANAAYVPGSISILSGANTGAKTDATGDDQAEYVAASRRVVVRLGTGANAVTGGALAPAASTSLRFRVTIGSPSPDGTTVSNQAALGFLGAQTGSAFASQSDGDSTVTGNQPTVTTVTAPTISGRVFEDLNYGGGAGRSLAASAGVVRPGTRVEFYDATGAYLAADTTDAAGLYAFDGWAPGSYTVRVVNGMVTSSRPGAVAGLLPVQTFRAVASTGTAVAEADRVGGEIPARADAGSNLTAQTLAALTTATTTAQSVAVVTLGTASISGIDFGFGFDVVVNANDAGQGSLRQFLLNANALGNTGLAQAGQTPGVETSIFMVSDGAVHPGLRAGLASLLTGGVVPITAQSALPAVTGASTRVDGGTQTANVGDSNPGALGTGGTVGVDALALP